MLQARRSRDRVAMRQIFVYLPNPSSRTIVLGSTKPVNRNEYQESSFGGKGQPAGKADLTALCEPPRPGLPYNVDTLLDYNLNIITRSHRVLF
jgi:hypothetical protein